MRAHAALLGDDSIRVTEEEDALVRDERTGAGQARLSEVMARE